MDKKHRSYHPYRSLNFKLLFIFFIATLIPVMGTTYIIAKLYIANYSKDQDILVRNTLVSISQNITTYLKELDQLTLTPYFNDDFIYALKVKANDSFDTSTDKYQVVRINNLLSSQLSFVRNIRKDILSTLMVSHNKILFYSSNNPEDSIADNFAFQDQEWYHKALQARGNAVFIEPHRLDYLKNEQSITAFSVVRAINDLKTHKPIGIIKSDANTIIFDKMFEELQFHVSSNIILMDQNKHVIYAKNRVSDSLLQQINDHPDGSVQDNKESYRVISKSLETYDWRLYILLSSTEIQQKANWIYLISLSFFALCLIIAFICYKWLSKKITKPVKEIITTMRHVKNGDFNARYRSKTKDEFEFIGTSLNSMIAELKQKIDKEYILVLKQRESEYKALQSQIQPHFIFNTLNGFITLNQIGETTLLEKSIFDLTIMLRFILNHQDMTTLEEEFSFIENYCSLQKLRFGSRLNTSIVCEEAIKKGLIPKLLLQPLVENAIIHGIEPLNQPCLLIISASKITRDEIVYIRIRIEDDGHGFDATRPLTGENIGISNTKDRLRLCYPNHIFQFESSPMNGTRILIDIPEVELNYEHSNS